MKIGILGDTHGNNAWVSYALRKFAREGIHNIIQVGDFGIWPGLNGDLFLYRTQRLLKELSQELYVVPGNHEDYSQIERVPVAENGWQFLREEILLAPRGHRWTFGGATFVALGGAPSVDRTYRRKKGMGWWPQEMITEEDLQLTVSKGYADFMICHDAPHTEEIDSRIRSNPFGFDPIDLMYADRGREVMDMAIAVVQPKFFLHGHYHFPSVTRKFWEEEEIHPSPELTLRERKNSYIVGLSKDMTNWSIGEIDTDLMRVNLWDLEEDLKKNPELEEVKALSGLNG